MTFEMSLAQPQKLLAPPLSPFAAAAPPAPWASTPALAFRAHDLECWPSGRRASGLLDICICRCRCVCVCICIGIHISVDMYIGVCICTYIYIHIHTCIYIYWWSRDALQQLQRNYFYKWVPSRPRTPCFRKAFRLCPACIRMHTWKASSL